MMASSIDTAVDAELSDSDEEEVTAQELLRSLETAWLDERLAPELLPHQHERLECMLGQLQHMERNILKLPPTELRHYAHKMELCRIKYVISSYLRMRLEKIEKFCISLVSEERQRIESGTNYLTTAEYRYAQEYLLNLENHVKTSLLDRMPGNMQGFEPAKMAVCPDLERHVFAKATETVNAVVVLEGITDDDDDILVNLEEGAQHIMQYKAIADLVKSGKVQLI